MKQRPGMLSAQLYESYLAEVGTENPRFETRHSPHIFSS